MTAPKQSGEPRALAGLIGLSKTTVEQLGKVKVWASNASALSQKFQETFAKTEQDMNEALTLIRKQDLFIDALGCQMLTLEKVIAGQSKAFDIVVREVKRHQEPGKDIKETEDLPHKVEQLNAKIEKIFSAFEIQV